MSKETVIESIIAHVFGHRYYANVINMRGTDRYEVCSFIFASRETAYAHRRELETTRSFLYIETISFRSRKDYPCR